jgi:hypothetical protein
MDDVERGLYLKGDMPMVESVDEFFGYARLLNEAFPEWRSGQSMFNALRRVRPDLSEQIRGNTELDPFYVDARIPAFRGWLWAAWND